MTSIYGLLTELQSFTTIESSILDKAKLSSINTSNNPKFWKLTNGWVMGLYDEDVESLVLQLIILMK